MNPKFPGAHYLMGHVYITKKAYDRALDSFLIAQRLIQPGETKWHNEHLRSIASLPQPMRSRLEKSVSASSSTSKPVPAEETGVDFMTKVPHEIVLQICSYLNMADIARMTVVCKSWRQQIAQEPKFWRTLRIVRNSKIDTKCFQDLVRRSRGLLNECQLIATPKIKSVAFKSLITSGCKNLRHLTLSGTFIARETVVEVVVGFKRLHHHGRSSLETLELNCPHLLDQDFSAMLVASVYLKSLLISNNDNFTGASLSSSKVKLEQLRSLFIHKCKAVGQLFYQKFGNIAGNDLKSLSLADMELESTETLIPLITSRKLELLEIRKIISARPWNQFLEHIDSEQLVNVNLSSSVRITDASLDLFLCRCERLQRLNLSHTNISDASVMHIIELQRSYKLRHLEIRDCCFISQNGMMNLAENISPEGFISLDCSMNPGTVSDAFIISLSSKTRDVTQLALAGCTALSGSGLADLLNNAQHLTFLNLDACIGISNPLIKQIRQFAASRKLELRANLAPK